MFAFFANSQYAPCPECGASLAAEDRDEHECDRERWVDFQMCQLRTDVARFEVDLAGYLGSTRGRFEAWYAERTRIARAAT